ncbi:hypothetical protein [Terricaulis sp.]|uniref:hypothetical protein n=1 Tax=Terricaulis sp. TaxID=2768686 RepID=UPI003783DBE5
MLKTIARNRLAALRSRYDYDTSYMNWLLDAAPAAFFKFAKLLEAASHREAAPVNAYFAAKLVAGMTEDCGPCTQLVVNMARDAGMPADQIEAVLRHDLGAMLEDTALGLRFAEAVAARSEEEDDLRDQVRHAWGDKGVVDLTFALQIGRMFPMIKAGLGFAGECRRVLVGDKPVDVQRRAA